MQKKIAFLSIDFIIRGLNDKHFIRKNIKVYFSRRNLFELFGIS